GGAEAVAALISLLDREHFEEVAATALALTGAAGIAALLESLDAEAPRVRYDALATLPSPEADRVFPLLVEALGRRGPEGEDPSDARTAPPLHSGQRSARGSGRRVWAAAMLGELSDPRVVEPLLEALLADEDGRVRLTSAMALARLGDRRAVHAL